MYISTYVYTVILLSLLAFVPIKSYSHSLDIPFFVTYEKSEGTEDVDIACFGNSGLRTTPTSKIKPGDIDKKFYTAKQGILPPLGQWSCWICDPNSFLCSDVLATVDFCFNKRVDIKLTIKDVTNNSAKLEANENDNCDSSKTTAALGDDNKPFKPDRDTFTFQGSEGDSLIITLEENPETSHLGEEATLIVRNANNGSSLKESQTGALPLEITTTLPAAGVYKLVVEQNGIPKEVRFRGNYFLGIKAESGALIDILPEEDVEF